MRAGSGGLNRRIRFLANKQAVLFHADCEDFFAFDFDFNAEWRAQIGSLYDPASDPDISGKVARAGKTRAAGIGRSLRRDRITLYRNATCTSRWSA